MKKMILWGLILLMISGFLTGCAHQPIINNDETAMGEVDEENMPVLTQDSGPAQGGRLNLFMTTPDTLNPLYSSNKHVRYLSQFIFDSLFLAKGEEDYVNLLAESLEFSDDGLILDIKLHDGVLFHNGTILSASDVAFTIDAIRQVAERSQYEWNIENIDSTKIIDRLNIRLILKKADNNFPAKLTFPILPEQVFKEWPIKGYDTTQKLIGSGAFRFDRFDGDIISLSRNDVWWYATAEGDLDHPVWLNGINFIVFDNENKMMQAFQKQQIDVAFVSQGNLDNYSNRTDILINQYEGDRFEYILLSPIGVENNKLANPELRTALFKYLGWYMALDPIAIGQPAAAEMDEYGSEGNRVNKEDTLKALIGLGMVYDENKNILSYYKNGSKIPFSLSLKYNSLDIDRLTSGEWVLKALGEIGIQVRLENSTEQEEKNLVDRGKFDLMILGSRIPLFSGMHETITILKGNLGLQEDAAVIFPLYRKTEAILYNTQIRGPRLPSWKNVYSGWMDWYLVKSSIRP